MTPDFTKEELENLKLAVQECRLAALQTKGKVLNKMGGAGLLSEMQRAEMLRELDRRITAFAKLQMKLNAAVDSSAAPPEPVT